MGFSEETSGDVQWSQVALAPVASFICPGVNAPAATLLNLNPYADPEINSLAVQHVKLYSCLL